MKCVVIWLLVLCAGILIPEAPVYAKSETKPYLQYQLQKGEWLAEILRKLKVTNLWTKEGAIQKTLSLNPWITSANQSNLPSGMWLTLPIKELNKDTPFMVVNDKYLVRSTKPLRDISSENNNHEYDFHKTIDGKPINIKVLINGLPKTESKEPPNIVVNLHFHGTQEKPQVKKKSFWNSFDLLAAGGGYFSSIQGTDSTASSTGKVSSEQGYYLDTILKYAPGEEKFAFLNANITSLKYVGTSSVSIDQESTLFYAASLGYHMGLSQSFAAQLAAGYFVKPFLQKLAGVSLSLQNIGAPGAEGQIIWSSDLKDPQRLRVEGLFGYYMGGSGNEITVEPGLGFGLQLAYPIVFLNQALEIRGGLGMDMQSSSRVQQNNMTLNLGVSYDF